jgi:DNA replication ATP-dependent helicase Dna2
VHTLLSGRYEQALGDFDLVIVDEAAQLTVPATLGAIRMAQKFVLIGDHRQLPAVVISKGYQSGMTAAAGADGNDLDVSLFEILSERLEAKGGEGLVHLRDQYRMNSAICQIPSQLWYGGELRPADKKTSAGRLELPLEAAITDPALSPEKPIVVIDVEPNAEGGPRTSLSEARIVRKLVRGLVDAGFPAFDTRRPLAVIAPFRAQVARIRTELEAEFPDRREEIRRMVDTVDRFQGSECDAVIVSLATGDGKIHELARNPRRLNVAITRARHKLIILGSVAAMRSEPLYRDLLEQIEAGAGYEEWCVGTPAI